jgi:hypothetical protein
VLWVPKNRCFQGIIALRGAILSMKRRLYTWARRFGAGIQTLSVMTCLSQVLPQNVRNYDGTE